MRKYSIIGLDGLCDDQGISEPFWAAEVIRFRRAIGEELTERDIEDIAHKFFCRVEWQENVNPPPTARD